MKNLGVREGENSEISLNVGTFDPLKILHFGLEILEIENRGHFENTNAEDFRNFRIIQRY